DLYHNSEGVSFHTSDKISTSKVVFFQNYLPFGVSIHSVKIIDKSKNDFQVNLIQKTVQIAPGDTIPAVRIKYLNKQENGYETSMKIYTNISNYQVPIKIYNGEIEIVINSIDKTQFDFGTLSPSDERAIHFTIQNYGTVPIAIEKFHNPLEPFMKIIYKGQKDVLINNDIINDEKSPSTYSKGDNEIVIKGKSISYFKLVLNLTNYSPLFNFHKKNSNIFSIMTKFNVYQYKILFNISPGGLIHIPPYKELDFGEIFPGQVVTKRLYLFNYFPQKMNLLRLSTLNNQGIIFFESNTTTTNNDNNKNKKDLIIQSGKINDLNRVILIPHYSCNENCYIGIQLHSSDGQWFTYGMKLPQNLAEIDYYLFKNMKNRYERLIGMKKNIIEDSIIIDTTHVKNYEIPIKGEMVWPRLMTTSEVIFPLTAVGNYTIMNLTIQNPSLQPIIVQLLPLVIYPDAETFLHSFKEFLPPMPQPIEINETLMFSLRDTELFTLRPDSPVPKLREDLESIVNTPIPRFTLSMLLQPGMKVRIRLGFLPTDHILRSSLLIIRNNLTVVESVVLMGRGAHINMEVDGKVARTKDPLLFDIQPFHLSDCHNPKRLNHKLSTTLTVKRSFMVKNTGEIPFTVVNMSINNYICENRGFRVLNCEPFTLKPNETHILDIAYTPDFLMSWNEAALQLYMHMNSTSWMYPIAASIPKHMLSKCYSALPRPPFEGFMYYSCVSALIFCLICVIACAYLEGDRTISHAIRLQYMPPKKVFDFKDITTSTITSNTIKNTNSNVEVHNEISYWKKGINYIISIVLYVCSLFWHEKITATRLRSSMKEPSKEKDKKKAVSETFKLYQETTRSIQKTALDTFKMRNPGLLKRDIDLEEITTNIKFKINENDMKKGNVEEVKEEEGSGVKKSLEIGKENNIIEKVVQQSNSTIKNQKGKKKGKGNKSNVNQNNKLSIVDEIKAENEKRDKKYGKKDIIDNKKESNAVNGDFKEKDSKKIKNTLNILKENIEAEKKIVKEKKIDKKKNEDIDSSVEEESIKGQIIKEEIDDKESGNFIQKWINSTKDDEKESSPDSVKSSSKKDLEEEGSYIDEEDVVDEMDPEEMDPELLIKKYKELKTKYAKDSSKKSIPPEIDMEKVKQVQKEILTQQFNMPLDDVAQWDPDNPCPPYQFMDLNSLVSDMISPNGIYNTEYMNSLNINPAAFNQSLNDPWNIMSAFTPGQNFFPPEHQMDNFFTNINTTIPSTGSSNYFQNPSFNSFDRTSQILPTTTTVSQSSMVDTQTTTSSNTTQQQNNFPISLTDEFNIWNPLTQENNETFDSWMKHTGIDKIIDDDEKKK
uniref:Transmembrane protein 131-like conserved domain-containing protein n=1 Tax=Strongyloides stercoralis TaxID=6248 RepID=A0AAF5CZB1_STRER